jgi:hypothetical protein
MIKRFQNFINENKSDIDPFSEEIWENDLIPRDKFRMKGRYIYIHIRPNRNKLIGQILKYDLSFINRYLKDKLINISKAYFEDPEIYNDKNMLELDDQTYELLITALLKPKKKIGLPNEYLKNFL